MAKSYAKIRSRQWFILSAKHGLLKPDTVIEPYETTLTGMKRSERQAWATKVAKQMAEGVGGESVLVLAGETYRDLLMETLRSRFESIDVPMQGLKMGQQLSWLSEMTAELERRPEDGTAAARSLASSARAIQLPSNLTLSDKGP